MTLKVKKRNLCVLVTLSCCILLLIRYLFDGRIVKDNSTLSTLPACYSGGLFRVLNVTTGRIPLNSDRMHLIFDISPSAKLLR